MWCMNGNYGIRFQDVPKISFQQYNMRLNYKRNFRWRAFAWKILLSISVAEKCSTFPYLAFKIHTTLFIQIAKIRLCLFTLFTFCLISIVSVYDSSLSSKWCKNIHTHTHTHIIWLKAINFQRIIIHTKYIHTITITITQFQQKKNASSLAKSNWK